ncbi:unnamed protein product [Brachionus calyciflorus]|uniref:small monomeric GTPase n=1 Tax=Brachionus calyciflorus TaxID=104777 RepID=A0A813S262_9BILA|nr:unnamed protein product [Brachionus calyciflorus]
MSLWNWLNEIFKYLGWFKKSGKIVFLGLDNAGKTTLLKRLKDDKLFQSSPTSHPTSEELILDDLYLTAYDLGGHKQVRKVWKEYLPVVDAIIFIIDVCDSERFNEARIELDALIADEQLLNCPILILGNKIDKKNALGEFDIRKIFNLYGRTTGQEKNKKTRPIELFMCSIKKREGYGDGLRWISQYF